MSPAVLHLSRITLLAVAVIGLMSCTSAHVPDFPPKTERVPHSKDYSGLRIGGRHKLKLPGIGVIHADKREGANGGEVLFSGRVFLEMSPLSGHMMMFGEAQFGKAQYAYTEKARWKSATGVLCLQGLSIIEFDDHGVADTTEAGAFIFIDSNGKITTN